MNGQQLKNSILQIAIQGKLVPQDPNDEPASVLLEKIRKEKEQLIKEGKIKKEKNFSRIYRASDNAPYTFLEEREKETIDITDELPFEIPDSWEWVRLSSVVYNHGQTKPISEFSYIDIGSIDNINQKLNDKENIISAKDAPSRARKIVKTNDIIYSTVRPYLHNMCIIDKEFSSTPIASTGFAVMACYKGLLNYFLFYYLLSPDFDQYANDTENSKGVAYPAINDEKLYKAFVPIPPLAEQQRIVDKLEEVQPFIDEYSTKQKKVEILQKDFPNLLKKSILQEAIQGKLVPQDPNDEPASVLLEKIRKEKEELIKQGKIKKDKNESIIFRRDNSYYEKQGNNNEFIIDDEINLTYPNSWILMKVKDVLYLSDGIKSKGIAPLLDAKYLRGKDLSGKSESGRFINQGEYLILVDGDNSGEVFLAPCNGYLGSTFKQLLIPSSLNNEYVLYILKFYQDLLRNNKKGAAIPHLNKDIFKNLIIPIPPIDEQNRIVVTINTIFSKISAL